MAPFHDVPARLLCLTLTPRLQLTAFAVDRGASPSLDRVLRERGEGILDAPEVRAVAYRSGDREVLTVVSEGGSPGWRLHAPRPSREFAKSLGAQGGLRYYLVGWSHLLEERVPEGFDAALLFSLNPTEATPTRTKFGP